MFDKNIFQPDYPFIDIPYLGVVNQKTVENMTQFYYFIIRYYDTATKSKRRRYYRMHSSYYHLSAFCEIEMRDKMFELSKDYVIDSYSIQSVYLNPDEIVNGQLDIREF